MASPNELSFLPDDYLDRKAQRRTNAICATLFLVVMVVIGSTFTVTERMDRHVKAEHATWQRKYTEGAKRIELKRQLEEKEATMVRQAELAASLLEKVPRSFLLAEITNFLPAGVSLLDVSMESRVRAKPAAAKSAFEQKRGSAEEKKKQAADAQGPKVYDVGLKVTGIAYTDVQVAQFITKLNASPLLRDVNLVIVDQFKDGEQQLRKFQIEAQLDPAAEVIPGNDKANATAAAEIKETNP